ncbi:nuclear transport factor 2 family protein [Corallococcus macrosporus]|uniref:Nuclear transport factor 2 family protein n=1 Tax=Corallococcus macrosporus TaxID=35 RepID=A0ABS3DJJ2_9BACT|nr:nuclear transport factor 2 family protein [Corallococcus macrosporus]MBN8231525.1 nuclear transport factor 2 family protein [Corallococcus macrosporus]
MLNENPANVESSRRARSTRARMVDTVYSYFDEVLGQGRLELIDALTTPGITLRGPARPESGAGREGLRRWVRRLRGSAPGIQVAMERRAIQGNKVAVRWRAEGLPPGPVPRGLYVFVFEEDRVAELWMHDLDADSCSDAELPLRAA